MSPPERDLGNKTNESPDGSLNADLTNTPLESNQSVHSSGSDDEEGLSTNGLGNYNQNGEIGYQQLSSNDVNDDFDDFQMLAESRSYSNKKNTSNLPVVSSNVDTDDIVNDEFCKLENEEIKLDPLKANAITSIMSNIKLADNCVPDWAKVIPEDIWKRNLLENLNARQTTLFDKINETETK